MENLDKKKKIIMYTSIAILILLIVSVIFFMIRTKIKEKNYNEDMSKSLVNIADNIVYDYKYNVKDVEGSLIMKFDIDGKTIVEKEKDDSKIKDGMLIAKYEGKKKITITLPKPIITSHEIKADKLEKEDKIENNKVINSVKIEIEDKILSSDVAEVLTNRYKKVLLEFLRAKGYKDISFK